MVGGLLLLSPGLVSLLPLSSSPLNLWVQLVQFKRSPVWEEGETSGVVSSPLHLQMISSIQLNILNRRG